MNQDPKAAKTNCTTTKKTGFSIEKLHISDCFKKKKVPMSILRWEK
jgi:hypothetical protein